MPIDSGRISEQLLREILISQRIDNIPVNDLLKYFMKEQQNRISPQLGFSVDPRSEEAIIYNPARAKRPHNYSNQNTIEQTKQNTCPICAGETTGIIDLASLSDGYTFINRNLFPVVQPPGFTESEHIKNHNRLWGLHLVQWTSSAHNQDWHNMPEEDCAIVMSRLAATEKKLVSVGREIIKEHKATNDQGDDIFVSIIKNSGAAVGGSLSHGHQQILLSNLAPRRLLDNQKFEIEKGITFSEYIQKANPVELQLRDYGGAVLLVSKFMRRPLEMILALRETKKNYLHQLDDNELLAVSQGWMDATRALHRLMPDYGREIAYNVVAHNGPGAGLYFEFLPYTQEQGGFEQLGLAICQADPFRTADQIRMAF